MIHAGSGSAQARGCNNAAWLSHHCTALPVWVGLWGAADLVAGHGYAPESRGLRVVSQECREASDELRARFLLCAVGDLGCSGSNAIEGEDH